MPKKITDNKDTYLVAAEMSAEDNYNSVGDGIVNNVPKPSLLERLEEFEQRKKERHNNEIAENLLDHRKVDYLNSKDER